MTRPLFSVVTVTLNCREAALETARSVLAQTYPGVEYLVKDGVSNDGTADALRALGVTVYESPDRGIYDAMNQARAHCSGEYVYYLNAGDTFAGPQVLADLAAQIDRRADVVYGELMLHPMGRRTRQPDSLSRYYLFRKNLNHQSWMARLEAYQSLGGLDSHYAFCADQDFIWKARLRAQLRFQHIDLVLANFVYGGASTTSRNRARVDGERWQLLRRYFHPWEIATYGLLSLYFLNPLKVRIRRLQLAAAGKSY